MTEYEPAFPGGEGEGMTRDQMAGDVRYAMRQLQRIACGARCGQEDSARRALDALERVEAGLQDTADIDDERPTLAEAAALEPQLGESWTTDEILAREG